MKLTPVDGDPFAQTQAAQPSAQPKLTPVDGNPFDVKPAAKPDLAGPQGVKDFLTSGVEAIGNAAKEVGSDLAETGRNAANAYVDAATPYGKNPFGALAGVTKAIGSLGTSPLISKGLEASAGLVGAGEGVPHVAEAPAAAKVLEAPKPLEMPKAAEAPAPVSAPKLTPVEGNPFEGAAAPKAEYDPLNLNKPAEGRVTIRDVGTPEAPAPKLTPVEGNPFEAVGAQASPTRPVDELATPEEGARGLIQQQLGLSARDTARQHETIERDIAPAEAKATPADQLKLRQYVETRTANPEARAGLSPELQKAADTHKSLMSDAQFQMEELDPAAKQHFIQDYLSHMYDQPEKFTAWATTQDRTIPTYDEAVKLGFEPKHKFIADTDKEYLRIINRWNASRRIENSLREQGHVSAEPVAPSPDHELVNSGRFSMRPAYMPKKIAQDYNTAFSQPYRGRGADVVGAVGDFMHDMRSIAFAANPAFHGVNEIYELIGHEAGRVLNNAREGQVGQAGKSLGSMLTGPVSPYLRGKGGMKLYLHPEKMVKYESAFKDFASDMAKGLPPNDAQLIHELTQANAIPSREFIDFGVNEMNLAQYIKRRGLTPSTIARAVKDGASSVGKGAKQAAATPIKSTLLAPRVALKGIAKALQSVSEPLFGHIIPRVKLGAQMQMLEDWHRANPNATQAQAIKAARKISKNADNVFGEMNRDNLFMKRATLQALDITMLSPSWSIGSARLLGGGTSGTLRRALKTFMPFDKKAPSFSMKNGEWDPTMTSFYGSTFASLMMGGATTYMLTGERPKELLDFIAPRTGGLHTEASGKKVPARLKPMGNIGWDLSLGTSAGFPSAGTQGFQPNTVNAAGLVREKLNPLLGAATDLVQNKDFKGQPIMGKEPVKQAAKYVGEQLTPFGLQKKSAPEAKVPPLSIPEAGMQYYDPKGFKGMMEKKGKPADERKKK